MMAFSTYLGKFPENLFFRQLRISSALPLALPSAMPSALPLASPSELGYYDPRPWHRDRPQRPKVWNRDEGSIWGVPPAPDFFRGRE
jgi:hypothetical protein